jgi:hypothetical protein
MRTSAQFRRTLLVLLLLTLTLSATGVASAQTASEGEPGRVLAILGDAWHRVAPLDRSLVGSLREKGWEAVVIMDYDVPWDEFDTFDLIILSREGREYVEYYKDRDVNPDADERAFWLTKEQSLKFVEYVNAGGRMLLYHDGFGNHPCDYGPAIVARACFIRHPAIVEISVTTTGKMPHLTEGVESPFIVADEEYELEMDESQTSVFLESHSPQHGRAPQGWAHTFGEGRVAVLIPGHRMDTITHPMIGRLVQNILNWLTEK